MSKKPKHPDQVAIDMCTAGTFLAVTALTYQTLEAIENIGDSAETLYDEAGKQISSGRKKLDELYKIAKPDVWSILLPAPTGLYKGYKVIQKLREWY